MGYDKTMDCLVSSACAEREAALRLCEASEEFVRVVSGGCCRVVPAPLAYDLLGELKVAFVHLAGVVRCLPDSLRSSLADPRLVVYDQDPWTGEQRDPVRQVELACEHMREVLNYLSAAVEAAEDAQVALNSQGYRGVQ